MIGGGPRHQGRAGGPAPRTAPTERWRVAVGGAVTGAPTVGPDGTIYVATHAGELVAVAPTGAIAWRFALGERSWSTPAVAEDGTIHVGSDDDHRTPSIAPVKARWKLRLGQCAVGGFGPEGTRCDADGGPVIGPDGTD